MIVVGFRLTDHGLSPDGKANIVGEIVVLRAEKMTAPEVVMARRVYKKLEELKDSIMESCLQEGDCGIKVDVSEPGEKPRF